jgi:Dna[CI] antecedent, DciA
MPRKPPTDKKTPARNLQTKAGFGKVAVSINDLLARRPMLTALAAAVPAQKAWVLWFRSVLPPELGPHIVNVVPKGPELTVLADSPVWCERLRYALAALETQITARDSAVRRTRVRVTTS